MTPAQAAAAWHSAVGRWYLVVSLLTGTTTFWAVVILLFSVVVLRRRRRNRAILDQWELEEGPSIPEGPIEPS